MNTLRWTETDSIVFAAMQKKRFKSDGDRRVGWKKLRKATLWKDSKLDKW